MTRERTSPEEREFETRFRHFPRIAVKDLASHRYSFRNHSYAFECPVCGLTKRYNANYLGRRVITCDGEKFTLTRPATDALLGGGQ